MCRQAVCLCPAPSGGPIDLITARKMVQASAPPPPVHRQRSNQTLGVCTGVCVGRGWTGEARQHPWLDRCDLDSRFPSLSTTLPHDEIHGGWAIAA